MKYSVKRRPVCLECGEEIAYGRNDRKFCSTLCKNKFNNRKGHDGRVVKMKVQNALNKNYEILSGLLKKGVSEIDILEVRGLGFRTDLATSYKRGRKRDELCCYDIRYSLSCCRVFSISKIPGMECLE